MRALLITALLCALLALWHVARRYAGTPLVVYCAHDAVYSEKILKEFEKRTAIPVELRFDTEATKSLGLIELLTREKDSPRCDVFWNNELLGMLELQEKNILLPYKGPAEGRIPAHFKDPQGYWTGFAARLRVLIMREPLGAEDVAERLRGDLHRVAIANPLYGTTLTHYSALWQEWGRERLIAWHRESRARGLRELRGNAAVKDAVVAGVCDFGFTDTDDFFEAKDAGAPVRMAPVRLEDGRTICIPNTVAIIRGTRREAEARKLVDFLLGKDTELALARSPSRQIPLGRVAEGELPEEVRELARWATEGLPLTNLGTARSECIAWLKAEALR